MIPALENNHLNTPIVLTSLSSAKGLEPGKPLRTFLVAQQLQVRDSSYMSDWATSDIPYKHDLHPDERSHESDMESANLPHRNLPLAGTRDNPPTQSEDSLLFSAERAHLLESRKPLEKDSSKSKPQRTRSFFEYEAPGRDALSEILSGQEPESETQLQQKQSDNVVMRLRAPQGEIVLRHIRRHDAPAVQKLLTPKVLVTLGSGEMENPGDFCSAVEYVEDYVTTERYTKVRHNDFGIDDGGEEGKGDANSERSGHVPKAFAIAVDDKLIGIVAAYLRTDVPDRGAELVYWLGEEYWGRGIASVVVKAYVDWLWRTFSWINRVDAAVYSTWNPASRRVLEKIGLKYEGTTRKSVWRGKVKGFSDMELWGMLREEWNELIGDQRPP